MEPNPQHPQPLEGNSQQNSAWPSPIHQNRQTSRTFWLSPLRDIRVDQPSANTSIPDLNDNPIDRIASNLFFERADNTSDNADLPTSAVYQNQSTLIINENHTWPPILSQNQQSQITEMSQQTIGTWPKHYYNNREQPDINLERNAGERFNYSTGPEATRITTSLGSSTTRTAYQPGACDPNEINYRGNHHDINIISGTSHTRSSHIWEQDNNLEREPPNYNWAQSQTPRQPEVETCPLIDLREQHNTLRTAPIGTPSVSSGFESSTQPIKSPRQVTRSRFPIRYPTPDSPNIYRKSNLGWDSSNPNICTHIPRHNHYTNTRHNQI